jgi:small subunit ribosomal protein S2
MRSFTTESLAEETLVIENSINNHAKETRSIETSINRLRVTSSFVPSTATSEPSSDVLDNYNLFRSIKKRTKTLGSVVAPYYKPHEFVVNPPRPKDITLELLLASQAHIGHSTSLWNPSNQRYIYGVRQGVHIISLEVIAAHLRRAVKVVEGVAYHGGIILFVGSRPGQAPAVVKAAKLAKGCHLFDSWKPGSITNAEQILAKCRIKALDKDDQPITGYTRKLQEWKALRPDLVVVMNPLENYTLLHECGLNNIPTIGVIDTNADPTWVTYPIPANDDRCVSSISLSMFFGTVGRLTLT